MKAVVTAVRRLWRGLAANWVGTAGVVLTTTSFLLFVAAEALRLLGFVTNAYVGLITYMALPALFVAGLLLIPVGWWIYRRRTGKSTRELLSERFDPDMTAPRRGGAVLWRTVLLLTLANVLFLGAGGARMLSFMDQPVFCGTACHSVMGPEWATYKASPHARVACVSCHVGSGAQAAVDAKLNGLWQLVSVTFDLYERPIPTPVHQLRPARETCEQCHWPRAFYGTRQKVIERHENDRASTPSYTTLALKVGGGTAARRGVIHWHVFDENEVRYMPQTDQRMAVRWLEVRQPNGSYKRYENKTLAGTRDEDSAPKTKEKHKPELRVMDCVDCHNRATHIYEDPEDVVDALLARGEVDRSLPFARRQAMAALDGSYAAGTGEAALARDFVGFYRERYPETLRTHARELDRAVRALQVAYRRNIHPRMNVDWNPYPNHLGHRLSPGCRRCHGPHMQDAAGDAVPHQCTLCHSILAYQSNTPTKFLDPPDPRDPECLMGLSLGREYRGGRAVHGEEACKPKNKAAPPRTPDAAAP